MGSRYVPGGGIASWSVLRRLVSRGGNLYARAVLGSNLCDLTAGFKCFRVAALRRFDLSRITSEGYCFQIELSYIFARNGFRVVEIPIVFEERRAGQSKMSLSIVLESLIKVWALRFAPPTAALRPSPKRPPRRSVDVAVVAALALTVVRSHGRRGFATRPPVAAASPHAEASGRRAHGSRHLPHLARGQPVGRRREPYARIMTGNMQENRKYPTHLPLYTSSWPAPASSA